MRSALATALVMAALVAGCTGAGDRAEPDFGEEFSVRGALAEIPLPEVPPVDELDGVVTVVAVDLAGAAALAGVDRPALDPTLGPPEYDGVFLEYTNLFADRSENGDPSPVVIPTVELVLDGLRLQSEADYRSELGWSAIDIDAIVDVHTFPTTRFDVLALRRDLDDVVARAGDDGIVDVGAGGDGELRIQDRTTLRPLGRPLRLAPDPRRGLVAVARDRPSVLAWTNGAGAGGTWVDLADLAAVAARLDDRDTYAAILATGDFQAPRIDDVELLADTMQQAGVADLDELLARYPITEAFSAVGAGWFGAADELRVSIVYAFADESAAQRTRGAITEMYRSEASLLGFPPLTQSFSVGEVTAEGVTVEVVLDPHQGVASRPVIEGLLAGNAAYLLHR